MANSADAAQTAASDLGLSSDFSPIQEGQLSVTGERMCTKYW